jgi:hypothetical protein
VPAAVGALSIFRSLSLTALTGICHVLTILLTLALHCVDAGRYTVPPHGSGANLSVAGFVVGALRVEENAVGFRFSLALSAVSSFVRV